MTAQALSLPALWATFRTRIIERKFVRDVGVLTVANAISTVLGFVQGILVARWLGPELYGTAALVVSYPSILFTFFDTRSVEASIKYLNELSTKREFNEYLSVCRLGYTLDIGVAGLTLLAVCVTARWGAEYILHSPDVSGLIILYTIAFLPKALAGTSCAVLSTAGQFSALAWAETLPTLLRTILILGFVSAGWGIAGVIWGSAMALALHGIVPTILAFHLIRGVWPESRFFEELRNSLKYGNSMWQFIRANWVASSINLIGTQLDVLILGYSRGPVEVGYYKIAKSLSSPTVLVINSLRTVIYPKLTLHLFAGRLSAARRLIVQSFYLGLFLAVVLLLFIPVSSHLISFFVGHAFEKSIPALRIFLIGYAIWMAQFWARPLMFAVKMKLWVQTVFLFNFVLLSGWMFVMHCGFQWIAAWWTVCIFCIYSLASIRVFLFLREPTRLDS